MQPLVSIIIPIYNAEKQIENCINSIQKQSYSNIEIICVNDGSKDATGSILDRMAKEDARIKVIHNENQGVSATRNCGIDNATGEYVQFVDSDDELYTETTEGLVETMQKEGSDIVFCGYRRSDGVDVHVPFEGVYDIKEVIRKFCVVYKGGIFNQPWNKLYKKELLTCRFCSDMSIAEDAVFNIHYLRNIKKVSFLDKLGYYYVVGNPNSLSVKYNATALESEKTKIQEVNKLMMDFGFEDNISELNHCFEEDFNRCIYQLIYASGKEKKILETEIMHWIYDEVWENVLIQNRNLKELDESKARTKIRVYIFMVLIAKKIRQILAIKGEN